MIPSACPDLRHFTHTQHMGGARHKYGNRHGMGLGLESIRLGKVVFNALSTTFALELELRAQTYNLRV